MITYVRNQGFIYTASVQIVQPSKLILLHFLGVQRQAVTGQRTVSTEAEASLVQGETGIIPCSYELRVNAVYWYKGQTYPSSKRLITLDFYANISAKLGEGYDEGLIDISMNYSLIIKNVSTEDAGRYFCEVLDETTGSLYRNHTDVYVIGKYSNYLLKDSSIRDCTN